MNIGWWSGFPEIQGLGHDADMIVILLTSIAYHASLKCHFDFSDVFAHASIRLRIPKVKILMSDNQTPRPL